MIENTNSITAYIKNQENFRAAELLEKKNQILEFQGNCEDNHKWFLSQAMNTIIIYDENVETLNFIK